MSPKKQKRQIPPKNRKQIPISATRPPASVVTKYLTFVRGRVIDWVSSGLLAVVAVAALFHFTSSPTRSVEVRARLSELAASRLQKSLASPISKVIFDTYRSESLDLSAASSFVVFGTAQTADGTSNRFIMVFEPSSQKLLDKIVGRPGFYDIGYWAVIPDVPPNELTAKGLDVEDLDRDGNKDIVIYLRSTFADSTAKGFLVLRKDKQDRWHLMGLPSLTQRLHSLASPNPSVKEGPQPVTEPKLWFSSDLDREKKTLSSLKEVAVWGVNEFPWTAKGAGGDVDFWMIRNGTKIQMFDHKLTGYKHFGVLANLEDGEAVLADHHLMVSFFKIGEDRLEPDPQWNWGFPMLSDGIENSASWKLSEFQEAGIDVHVVDGTVFRGTEFGLVDDEE